MNNERRGFCSARSRVTRVCRASNVAVWLGTLAWALAASSVASATPAFWIGQGAPSDNWYDAALWSDSAGNSLTPSRYSRTYISTSDLLGLGVGPALIDGGVGGDQRAETAALYVGGWEEEWESLPNGSPNGSPLGHIGALEITAGELVVREKPDPNAGPPNCNYARIGFRGARGTVQQSGGSVYTCTYISLAARSPDSVGSWNLSDGEIETFGLDVGVQGSGIFEMTGGSVKPLSYFPHPGPIPEGRTVVGHGNSRPTIEDGRYSLVPGVGVFQQSGGTYEANRITVGVSIGSVGSMTVRGASDTQLIGNQILELGYEGMGSLTQTGGRVVVGRIVLGFGRTGVGQYSLWDGEFEQTGIAVGDYFQNGVNGSGHLVIIGPRSEAHIAGNYFQNGNSRLSFVLEEAVPGKPERHVTPLTVAGSAIFKAGSRIHIRLDENFIPQPDERLLLVSAAQIIDRGVELEAIPADDWSFEINSDRIVAIYTGQGAIGGACDDGIDNDGDGWIDFGQDAGCDDPSDASEYSAGIACDDGIDNDGDGWIDFGQDAGCDDPSDASEYSAGIACDDGIDNDGDGWIDFGQDAGCDDPSDASEYSAGIACDDGIDNDGDGWIDFGQDAGCDDPSDASEYSAGIACDDGIDNDGDGRIDFGQDAGCDDPSDASEYSAGIACDDGIDNDGDGWIDFGQDAGCDDPSDASEYSAGIACDDGIDNDGDGWIDFLQDSGCESRTDTSEHHARGGR